MPVRIDDDERRARLVARHHLGRTAGSVADCVRSVVALHSSDPITPHLAAWARVPSFRTAQFDEALLDERVLWRLHAMRRTLFVAHVEDGRIMEPAVSREVARKERKRLEGWLAPELRKGSAARWIARVEARVLEVLADGSEQRTQALAQLVPEMATELTLGSGKWATRAPLGSRLLFLMAMDGRVVRTAAAGSWRSSQYRWAHGARWFGEVEGALEPARARTELARRYLRAFGPVTLTDLRWWAGITVKHARAALDEVGARAVRLDGGAEGFVLADDLEAAPRARSVALLPGLDPTPMGWKERAFYLGEHAPQLFDTNGNVGPTVWVDGRVAGGWAQRPDGEVVHQLFEDVGREAAARVDDEAARLTAWMQGVAVTPRFRTPLERTLSAVRTH